MWPIAIDVAYSMVRVLDTTMRCAYNRDSVPRSTWNSYYLIEVVQESQVTVYNFAIKAH